MQRLGARAEVIAAPSDGLMASVVVLPGALRGALRAIPDKGHAQRLYALALLARGETRVAYPQVPSDDERVALSIVRDLGAEVTVRDGVSRPHVCIRSEGRVRPRKNQLCFGESALSLRMFSMIVANTPYPFEIQATATLRKRTQKALEAWLCCLGVSCRSRRGHPPLHIRGPMATLSPVLEGRYSSQLLTGLLMAHAALPSPPSLYVKHLVSRPYVSMTLATLKCFGVRVTHSGYRKFAMQGSRLRPPKGIISVSGDWSGMAFFIVGAMIGGHLRIEGLSPQDTHADCALLELIRSIFPNDPPFHWADGRVLCVARVSPLLPFTYALMHTPDIFAPLVLWACAAQGTSVIKDTDRLLHKESDRLRVATQMLIQMKVPFSMKRDCLFIHGNGGEMAGGVSLECHGDHRMIMLAAMLGVISRHGVQVKDTHAVSKSFPAFFDYLRGCSITVEAAD